MTCEDCLHIEVCAYIKPDLPICSDFADRSRYVVQKNGEWKLVEFQSSPFDTDHALVCSCCGLIDAPTAGQRWTEVESDGC